MARILEAKNKKIEDAQAFLLPSQRAKIKRDQEQKLQEDHSRSQLHRDSSHDIYLNMVNLSGSRKNKPN
jgi:hypothetical protein